MNNFNGIGNIGRDAEVRFTSDGTPILLWSLAVKHGYGKSEGTTWINCVLYGKRAESLQQYIKKGGQLGINGEIVHREYINKDGEKKMSLECRVANVTLLKTSEQSDAPAQTKQSEPSIENMEDDIPF